MNGGRTPLFERLIDFAPDRKTGDDPAMTVLSMPDLRASVMRELARLLGTRTAGIDHPAAVDSVLGYGIPDFMDVDPAGDPDRRRVERAIREAIIRFEPRLRRPQVTIKPGTGRGTLIAEIAGELAAGLVVEPLFFEMSLNSAGQAP